MAIRDPPTVPADVVQAEFELTNLSYPFVDLSAVKDCKIKLEEMLPQRADSYRAIYSIRDVDPEELLQRAETYDGTAAQLIARRENGGLLELSVSEKCPVMFLVAEGAYPRRVSAIDGVGRITADILPDSTENDVLEAFVSAYPTAELLKYRQQSHHTPVFSHREINQTVQELLTDRQMESLEVAYEAGYYEWPRGTTGEELAATMGITPSTFHQHLRNAEQKLVALLFD